MSQTALIIKLLLVQYATQSHPEIQAACYQNVSVSCPGVNTSHVEFRSLTWYKLNSQNKKLGIIRQRQGKEDTQKYNFSRVAMFGEEYSLLLPNVTPADSGRYECAINAHVGGKNQNFEVDLMVHECVKAEQTVPTAVLNTTCTNPLFHKKVEDLPVTWSVIGYVAVALVKIALSLITIGVIQVRSSRREKSRWHS